MDCPAQARVELGSWKAPSTAGADWKRPKELLSPGLEMVASWSGGGIGRFSSKDTQLSFLLWSGVKDISLFMHPSCCRYSAQWKRHGVAVCSPFPDQASAH